MSEKLDQKHGEALETTELGIMKQERYMINNKELFCRFFNTCYFPPAVEIAIIHGVKLLNNEKDKYLNNCTYKGYCSVTYEENSRLEEGRPLKLKKTRMTLDQEARVEEVLSEPRRKYLDDQKMKGNEIYELPERE